MGHYIQVVIGKEEIIDKFQDKWIHAHKLLLKQGFALVPLTKDLFDDITELVDNKQETQYVQFNYLNSSINELLKSESHKGALAYLETEYFGGSGVQVAILYKNQQINLGPLKTERVWNQKLMSYETIPQGKNAINKVLEEMGVSKIGGKDEFDSVELGFYRSNGKILKKSS